MSGPWKCRFWHRWERWSNPTVEHVVYAFFNPHQRVSQRFIQRRVCLRCGREERREVYP